MKLGKVYIGHGYVVDLDNKEMVEHARDALYEDMISAYNNRELALMIKEDISEDASESDIPDFLTENLDYIDDTDETYKKLVDVCNQ